MAGPHVPLVGAPRLALSAAGDTPFERLLGHNPEVLALWSALERALFTSPTFRSEFKEQVRRALAFGNRCEYCMAKAGPRDATPMARTEELALAIADQIGRDHRAVHQGNVEDLRRELGDAAAAELLALCCFVSASQMFGALTGLSAADLPAAR